jgi:hypothetical protein
MKNVQLVKGPISVNNAVMLEYKKKKLNNQVSKVRVQKYTGEIRQCII